MTAPTLYILNGPNLNLLGEREPQIYGTTTLAEIEEACRQRCQTAGFDLDFRQTNFEGDLIESIHEARRKAVGIIINPAGYSFTSVALLDALKMFEGPRIELHISNIHRREEIYQRSLVSKAVTAVIAGLGPSGYGVAIEAMRGLVDEGRN